MGKPRLTKRLQHLYNETIRGRAGSWHYPHPCAYDWGSRGGPSPARTSAWQAYLFAKEWHSRAGVDLKRLEGIVLRGGDAECVYRYVLDVPGASVRRAQRAVVACGAADVIRKFALNVPGADVQYLEAAIIVAEVMGG